MYKNVIPTQFIQYFHPKPKIKADILHFKHVVSFQISCGVQCQNNKNYITVTITKYINLNIGLKLENSEMWIYCLTRNSIKLIKKAQKVKSAHFLKLVNNQMFICTPKKVTGHLLFLLCKLAAVITALKSLFKNIAQTSQKLQNAMLCSYHSVDQQNQHYLGKQNKDYTINFDRYSLDLTNYY